MVQINEEYFSYTINVSPNKYISGKQWKNYSLVEQEAILTQAIHNYGPACGFYKPGSKKFYFELTKNKMTHVHGSFVTCQSHMNSFQEKVHNYLGLPKMAPKVVMMFEATRLESKNWEKYMTKEKTKKDEAAKAVDCLMKLKIDSDEDRDFKDFIIYKKDIAAYNGEYEPTDQELEDFADFQYRSYKASLNK